MTKGILLSKKPYKVGYNGTLKNSIKIVLSPLTNLDIGDYVYEVRRPDGIIELVPEKLFDAENYN